jgi:hypothetical protein
MKPLRQRFSKALANANSRLNLVLLRRARQIQRLVDTVQPGGAGGVQLGQRALRQVFS